MMQHAFGIRQVLPTDEQVVSLIEKLNAYQIQLYGLENCNLEAPEELIQNEAYMLGVYNGDKLLGIGAVKIVNGYGEIKRMYVEEEARGQGIAEAILKELEQHAINQGATCVCLETGNYHEAAIPFYQKLGYQRTEKFGNYRPNKVSVYFEKHFS